MKLSPKERHFIGKSGFKGVHFIQHKGVNNPYFEASVKVTKNGRQHCIYLGRSNSAHECAEIYDREIIKIRGKSAMTNKGLGLFDIGALNDAGLNDQHLCGIALLFVDWLYKRPSKRGSFTEFVRFHNKDLNHRKFTSREIEQILFHLEKVGGISIANKKQVPQLAIVAYKHGYKQIAEHKAQEIQQKEENAMKDAKDLTAKTPEELELLAKQLLEMSEVKKKEIANGDQIRKTLNPLILNVCQAKGKYDRLLEQMLDASTELDNAVKGLKAALKF